MKLTKLYQPESNDLTVSYMPDEQTELTENPPRFSWMPAKEDDARYVLQIAQDESFDETTTLTFEDIEYNFFTLEQTLAPGRYYWRYALQEEDGASEWSRIRSFVLPKGLPETPLLGKQDRYRHTHGDHPRLWLNKEKIELFRKALFEDEDHCGWKQFYKQSVEPWLKRPLILEPKPYPGHKRVAHLWRQMYMDCQETLYAIRHLSVAGVILQDETLIERAKMWLEHVLEWDVNGTTSRDYNDEAAFRTALAIAWGYDWLHDSLDESTRKKARKVLLERTRQVATHVMERSKIHQVPFDSHAVRALSMVIIPCSISLYGDEDEARKWLDYAVEYFAVLYPPWGGADGGWSEGPMYWTIQMAFVADALNWLKSYTGIDLFKRPFFRNTGNFPLYCYSPDTVRASFGDQSNLGGRPGLKTAFNMRFFAGITNNRWYQWYYEQVKEYDTEPEKKFFNYGWWDFPFDEMVYRHDYGEIEADKPRQVERVKWFRDIGWVAMHRNMHDPKQHLMLLVKSSPYGSLSHSHGDQNNFVLHAYGEPIAVESGHYVAFNSSMHIEWRRQTRSTNNLLIDGKGQYAGTNKVMQKAAQGQVEEVRDEEDYSYVRMNATAAYAIHVPYLKRIVREVYLVQDECIVIVDQVDLEQEAEVQWLFHTPYKMEINGQKFRTNGKLADMTGQFLYCSAGPLHLSQTDEYTGVDPKEIDGLEREWHLTACTKKAKQHRIVSLLVPFPKGQEKQISSFIDDQDHGLHVYVTHRGKTVRIEVPKAY